MSRLQGKTVQRKRPTNSLSLGRRFRFVRKSLLSALRLRSLPSKVTDSASDLRCELPPKILLTIKVCSLLRNSTPNQSTVLESRVSSSLDWPEPPAAVSPRWPSLWPLVSTGVISMENYSIVMNDLTLEERAKQNYDAPHAIDVRLLESHIRDYAAGRAIEAPICDFAQHLRVRDRRELIPASSLLIVEGI